jgi:hypothetical protein
MILLFRIAIERCVFFLLSHSREQQIKSEPCSELELIAIRACAATLCCGVIKDEWFQKTVIPWLDQFMAAHEVRIARQWKRTRLSFFVFDQDLSNCGCKFLSLFDEFSSRMRS